MSSTRVVVVGGGIAGLATAFRVEQALRRRRVSGSVTVLEAGPRVGGNIRSEVADGFTLEWGPNGFLDNVPSTLQLASDLGLGQELHKADPRAAIRYLWRNERLHPLPTGPLSFLTNPVLSLAGRLRVLLEPFQGRGPTDEDESVQTFGVRRIGREAADVLIDAMVSGVFAGNAATLSLPSAFPKMRAMEAQHGSLVKAMIARRRTGAGGGPSGPGGTLTSFRAGMETLPRALAESLGNSVRVDAPVRGLRRDEATGTWSLLLSEGEELSADHVVLAVPASSAADIAESVSHDLADALRDTETASLAVVALGYRESDLASSPDGFGFLVPRSEKLRILGSLRDSTIFPGRAPAGHALLRVMIGGAHDPYAVSLSNEELLDIVRGDLATTLGISADPVVARVFRHPLGISQYTLGHGRRVASVQNLLESMPGLTVTGSSYLGVSLNSCVENAALEADAVADRLAEGVSERAKPSLHAPTPIA